MSVFLQEDARILAAKLIEEGSIPDGPQARDAIAALELDCENRDGMLHLARPVSLLDPATIMANVGERNRGKVRDLHLPWQIGSTNDWLLEQARRGSVHARVCMAEQQVAGKGRRGRHWVSPFARNIYLSIGWHVPGSTGVGGLSLAVGIAMVSALRDLGANSAGLKWPNDVLLGGAKLAGILIELGMPVDERVPVVVGIGVNCRLDATHTEMIDQPFSTLDGVIEIPRDELAGRLIDHAFDTLELFSASGFAPFVAAWPEVDVYAGREVRISMGEASHDGKNCGIDSEGNILVDVNGVVTPFNAGEVSLRPLS